MCVWIWIIFHMIKAYVYLTVSFFSRSSFGRSLRVHHCVNIYIYVMCVRLRMIIHLVEIYEICENESLTHTAPHILCFPTFDLCEISSREFYQWFVFGDDDGIMFMVVELVVNVWHLVYNTIIYVVGVQKSIENGIYCLTSVSVSFAIQPILVVFSTVWVGQAKEHATKTW